MDWENISDDVREKARECKTPEEILELAKCENVKLSDEQIEAISGGSDWSCPTDGVK